MTVSSGWGRGRGRGRGVINWDGVTRYCKIAECKSFIDIVLLLHSAKAITMDVVPELKTFVSSKALGVAARLVSGALVPGGPR